MKPPAPSRLSLLSPEITVAAHPARLRGLLKSRFAPEVARLVTSGRSGKARLATARALWGRRVPLPVADAWLELARLATPSGRDAIIEAARDKRMEPIGWDKESPVDLAARLLADQNRMSGVLVRAHLRLARLPVERATYELRAAAPRRVPEGGPRALAAALRQIGILEGSGEDGWTDAWVHEDEESGDLHAVVLYGAASDGSPDVGGAGPDVPAARRTLRADAFHYRVGEGRLVMTAARPQRLEHYAILWGAALYDELGFFLREAPSLTLKPLQGLGAAGLSDAKLPPEIQRPRVVACQLDTGRSHRVEAHGLDALTALAPHLRAGGHLTRATLRFDVAGEFHPVEVVLRPPHRIDIGWAGVAGHGARGPRIAREALASLGLLSPGVVADDITTLLPLVHPPWRWRELVGDDGLAAMRAAGVLAEVLAEKSRRPAHPSARHLGGSAIAFRLFRAVGGRGRVDPDAPAHEKKLARAIDRAIESMRRYTDYYAVPEDWSNPAFTVSQHDLVTLRLSLWELLRKARREMGLERGEKVRLPRGVHRVGEMRVEGGVVAFFYVVRAATRERERVAIGRAVTKAAGFGRAVVFVPRGRRLGRDFVEIELTVAEQLGAASWRGKVAEAVRALGIEDRVAPELVAPSDVRLVVDRKRERVVLDGVPLVKLGENGYRLLRVLAERAGVEDVVPTRETDKAISGARASEGATRHAAWKMRAWIEGSFEEAGRELAADVKEAGLVRAVGRKGWTLTVKGAVT